MATWPPGVSFDFIQPGFSYQLGDGTIRTPNDVGPANVRPRFTAIADQMVGLIRMSLADFQTVRLFHKDTLVLGSLPFDQTDPVLGVTRSFRFLKPPRLVSSGAEWGDVSIELEILP